MNFLFLRQPPSDDPQNGYVVAAHSKQFAIDNARITGDELRRAQQRLGDAVEKNNESWDTERAVAAAEDNLDVAEDRLDHALAKRGWEMDDKWKTLFPRTAAVIARTRTLMLRINWPAIRPKL